MNIFTPLNNLITATFNAGLSNLVYNLWAVLDYVFVLLFCLFYRKYYGLNKRDAILIPLILYVLGALWIRILGWAMTGFTIFGPNNIVKGYAFFPVFALIVAKLFKKDFNLVMDFTGPCFPMTQFIGHQACLFAGCCYGYPMAHGLWNPVEQDYLFPIQIVESLVALLIVVICILMARKNKFRVTGKVYPVFLILFGGTRFFLEFLRNNSKLFWGISDLALWALLMVVVGIVWLVIAKKRGIPEVVAETPVEAPAPKKNGPDKNTSKKRLKKRK